MATTSTTTLTGLIATAYDQAVEFAFQPQLKFSQMCQQKAWTLSTAPVPGSAVKFTIFSALTAVTGALPETSDPGAQTLGKTQKTVTMYEYGKLVTTTNKLRVESFTDIDLDAARIVGTNMGESVDTIARINAFDACTASAYIYYMSGVHATAVVAANVITADIVRYSFNRLERNNVSKFEANLYGAVINSDAMYDLKKETGAGAWRTPREYVEPEMIWNGEAGEFEGFRFVVSSLAKKETDGGSGSVDLYTTYFAGFQAGGYAEGVAPGMDTSGPFDAMQRLMHVFWYGLIGYGELRRESLFKVFSSSSIGSNA